MKTYKFLVSLCGGWCNGHIEIKANNEEEAYNKAMDHVVNKLVKAFPTLDIEYNVECETPDQIEYYQLVISVLDEHGNRREAHEITGSDDKNHILALQEELAQEIQRGDYNDYANFDKGETLSADIEVHDDATWELLRIE